MLDDPVQVEVHAPDNEFDSDEFASENEAEGEDMWIKPNKDFG